MASTPAPNLSLSSQFYHALLNVYPRPFREEYEREMVIVFRDSMRAAHRTGNAFAIFYCWLTSIIDLATTATHEWLVQKPSPVHYAHQIGVGIVAGLVGGVVAGVGARLAMRGVSLVAGLPTGFSLEGTLVIIFIGAVMGSPFGIAYLAFRNLLPGTSVWKGLTFGLMLFVIFLAPPLLFYREGEFAFASPFIGMMLFAPITFAYGLTTAFLVQRLEKESAPATVAVSQPANQWVAIGSQIIKWLFFATLLEFSILGTLSILNHMPRIPMAFVYTARQIGLPFSVMRDVNYWLIILTALGYFGIASALYWKRTQHAMTRFTAIGLFLFGGALFNTGATYYRELADPEKLRPLFSIGQMLGVTALLALLYLFPNGRVSRAWTRPLALAWVAFAMLWWLTPLAQPLTFTVIIVFFISGLFAQFQRYRLASTDEQSKLRWPLIGFTIAIVSFSLLSLIANLVPNLILPKVDGLSSAATFGLYMLPWLSIPLTIGWAMRKHKLWIT